MLLLVAGRTQERTNASVHDPVDAVVDRPYDEGYRGQTDDGRYPLVRRGHDLHCFRRCSTAQRVLSELAQPVDGEPGDDDGGERLPNQRVRRRLKDPGRPLVLGWV